MRIVLAFLTVLLLTLSIFYGQFYNHSENGVQIGKSSSFVSQNSQYLQTSNASILVPFAANSISKNLSGNYSGTVKVLVTFELSNKTELTNFLDSLSNPLSPYYHRFLTATQFTSKFAPSKHLYKSALEYFSNFKSVNLTTYADRVSIGLSGPANSIGAIFNTSFGVDLTSTSTYHAYNAPKLPAFIGEYVSEISGLTNAPDPMLTTASIHPLLNSTLSSKIKSPYGYPQPISSGGTQYIYGSDLQVAYDEQALLTSSYPTNQVVATILWSGTNSNGASVAPFVPSDIYDYYNSTIPSGQPHSQVFGVPINGAPPPGSSASSDTTGANVENTLDLEMIGSTAPGSSIYNVYGPNPTTVTVDDAFAYILNPGSQYPQLENVSVISNSWGGSEFNDTTWYTYLEEAQARGISVLASSGDSGNNQLNTPAAMAYDNFGTTAVGGTTLVLNSNTASPDYLQIQSQTAWYDSTGGISSIFNEPSWQSSTEANSVINGMGRGVPDIGAIGNNTAITLTVNGAQGLYGVAGTSVASPVEAGTIAEIDNILNLNGIQKLGYLNPVLYNLGDRQYSKTSLSSGLPYYDIVSGVNSNYPALGGYDLVTGWGSINAYNFSRYAEDLMRQYSVTFEQSGLPLGNQWYVTFDGQKVGSTDGYINFTEPNGTYAYQVSGPSNFNPASTYGNITVSGANITQNVNFVQTFPVNFTETGLPTGDRWYVNLTDGTTITSTEGHAVSSLENGSYTFTVSTTNKTYYANGSTLYVNGAPVIVSIHFLPFLSNVTFEETGLPPGIVWYLKVSHSSEVYGGTNSITIGLQNGSYGYIPSSSMNSTYSSPDGKFTVSGSQLTINVVFQKLYSVTFSETGLPTGTAWTVKFDNAQYGGTSPDNIYAAAINGTYNYVVGSVTGYHATAVSGSVTVEGSGVSIQITFVITTYSVEFSEQGLPSGTFWYVNLTSETGSSLQRNLSSQAGSVATTLPNGTYYYSVASGNKSFFALGSKFIVSGSTVYESIYFQLATYPITFEGLGLPAGIQWNLSIEGKTYQSTSDKITLSLPNGSYTYGVEKVSGYHPVNQTGKLTVLGGGLTVKIEFTGDTYPVTIFEYNLPSGTQWWINFTNGQSYTTNADSVTFALPNGTYYFSLQDSNKSFVSQNSYSHTGFYELIVDAYYSGYSLQYYVSFTPMYYKVTLHTIGLKPGTTWGARTNSTNIIIYSNRTDASVLLLNGTYHLKLFTYGFGFIYPNGDPYTEPWVNFTVDGSNITINATFQRYYQITFVEKGLPYQDSWQMNVSAYFIQYDYESPSFANISELNGTYRYEVPNLYPYFAVDPNGSFTVDGSNITIDIIFEPYSYIYGNVGPGSVNVKVNGNTVFNGSGYFNVSVRPGYYQIEVSENGYTPFYENISLAVGKSVNVDASLSPNYSGSNTQIVISIVIGSVASVIGGTGWYYKIRKKK